MHVDEFSSIHLWNGNRQGQKFQTSLGVKVGIGDDTAVISMNDVDAQYELLYTVDTMVEDIHFNARTMSFQQIGYKALAANISDIAAMGGIPLHALVAISVPATHNSLQIKEIYDGIYQCANQHGVAIVGGDTTSAPYSLTISVTLIGKVEKGRAILRSGANAQDIVFLTGVAGQSAAGLHALLHPSSFSEEHVIKSLIDAHQRPIPHLEAGRMLLQSSFCHSLNDVSDGLASELSEIAKASSVDIVIEEQLLPISESMSQYAGYCQQDMLDWILYGGEDYILVGTASVNDIGKLAAIFQNNNHSFFQIGHVESGTGQVWLESWNKQFEKMERTVVMNKGYNHFRK